MVFFLDELADEALDMFGGDRLAVLVLELAGEEGF